MVDNNDLVTYIGLEINRRKTDSVKTHDGIIIHGENFLVTALRRVSNGTVLREIHLESEGVSLTVAVSAGTFSEFLSTFSER